MGHASHLITVSYKLVLTERNVSLLFGGELDSCHSDVLPVEGKEGFGVCRGTDKSLARPTSRCILFDGENISFEANLVIYINCSNIPPIMIISRIYETENLLSLQLVSFLVGLRIYQHPRMMHFFF